MAENHRIATFQANDLLPLSCRIEQQLVDGRLLCMMLAASLAYIEFLGTQVVKICLVNQIVVEDDISLLKCLHSLHSKQLRVTGAKAHQRDVPLTMQHVIALEECFQVSTSFEGCYGQIALQRMGLEGQHFADFVFHTQSFQGTGGYDGSINLAVAHLADPLLNAATDAHNCQVRAQILQLTTAHRRTGAYTTTCG